MPRPSDPKYLSGRDLWRYSLKRAWYMAMIGPSPIDTVGYPKVWHQPWVRITAETTFRLQFLPKVFQLLLRQSAFQKRSRVHPRRRAVPGSKCCRQNSPFLATMKKMIVSDFIKRCAAGEGANVTSYCPKSIRFLFARTTIAMAFQRMMLLMRRSSSRFPGYGGCLWAGIELT